MAPRLPNFKHKQILSMILRGFSNDEIANLIPCTTRAVRRIRESYSRFGRTTAPPSRRSPEPKITPVMRDVPYDRLAQEPDMVRREMVSFFRDTFEEDVSMISVTRALKNTRIT
jgi:hypothetical protein